MKGEHGMASATHRGLKARRGTRGNAQIGVSRCAKAAVFSQLLKFVQLNRQAGELVL
jgi:hypothetical protein